MANGDPAVQDRLQAAKWSNAEYVIEKGIPPPLRLVLKSPGYRYPLPALEIGESFLIKREDGYNAVRTACSRYSKLSGKRFVTRKGDEGIRVWRIE